MENVPPSPEVKLESEDRGLKRRDPQPPIFPAPRDDVWNLPGRLRINPSLWDKDDVAHWLHWAQKECSLRRLENENFEMNGRALCLLTKEDFRRRCPSSGDVLYEVLQCVKQQRRSVAPHSPKAPTSAELNPRIPAPQSAALKVQELTANSGVRVIHVIGPAVEATKRGSSESPSPVADISPSLKHNRGACASPPTTERCLEGSASSDQEPLNLSSRDKAQSPRAAGPLPGETAVRCVKETCLRFRLNSLDSRCPHLATSQAPIVRCVAHSPKLYSESVDDGARLSLERSQLTISHLSGPERVQNLLLLLVRPKVLATHLQCPTSRLLCDFMYQLLCDPQYQDYIRWESRDSHTFRVVDPNGLARLWGRQKNRVNMTYEKMSRAMRHYYKLDVMRKVRGQKHLFRCVVAPCCLPAASLSSRSSQVPQNASGNQAT
ncbi:transcription factor ETV7-like [Neosynchiropus ocellatus]